MAESINWTPIDLSDERAREDAIDFARMVIRKAGESHFDHDLEWALDDEAIQNAVVAFHLTADQGVLGFALLLRQSQPLNFQFGGLTYYRRQITRYNLRSAPLIVGVEEGSEIWQELASAFLNAVNRHLSPSFEVIAIEGIPIDSPFHRLLFHHPSVKRTFSPMLQGGSFARQAIQLPATLDMYLNGLGNAAKKVLSSGRKRILRDFADDVDVTCFECESDVALLLDHVARISEKRRQGNLLQDCPILARRLRLAARKTWLRSYVLFCSGRPTAFMIGYQCEGRLQAAHVGVDPDYRRWSVGTALLREIIDDLYARDRRPELVVLARDIDASKVRFVNHERNEVDVLLLPRTIKHAILAGAHQRLDGLANFAKSTANRINVRQGLKKTIRKFSPS